MKTKDMLMPEPWSITKNKGKIMRIFAGALKGMNILSPKDSLITRPTSAKIREAILHKVQDELQQSVFIDLFSGTGAVAIEAVSRGAQGAYLVENNKNILKILRKNFDLAHERMLKQGFSLKPFQILPIDATKALKKIKTDSEESSFVIWADPPYSNCLSWLAELSEQNLDLLDKTSLIIVEADRELITKEEFKIKNWTRSFEKIYGGTAVIGWTKNQKEAT